MVKKIAIIDDEIEILDSIKRFLSRYNQYEIDTYKNPDQAISYIHKGYYDLILLDISMPKRSGIEILKEIKSRNKDTKVIMITANSTLNRAIECNKYGAENYLTKPFISLRDVENKVASLLNIK